MKLNSTIVSSANKLLLMSDPASAAALESHPNIKITYNPPDGEFNIWMYGVIFIGCVFVLFVIAGVYSMCNSPSGREPVTPIRRHPTVRGAIATAPAGDKCELYNKSRNGRE